MLDINFGENTDMEHHACEAEREGDWIIFRCSQCQGYERRINWLTGEMSVANSDPYINHQGFNSPGATVRAHIFGPSFLN